MKKRSFLIIAVAMTMAGVASAFALGAQEPAARDLSMPVVARQPAPVSAAPAPPVKTVSLEARLAPVPLLMKPRPTIEQPIFAVNAVGPEVPAKIGGGSGESA